MQTQGDKQVQGHEWASLFIPLHSWRDGGAGFRVIDVLHMAVSALVPPCTLAPTHVH